ncbi:hypothetical protein DAPPUDRAFT_100364 [Daphnia pulex]|uniref:Transmembrane protein n=1 Tax=Daphnia pulex TaxID=6669 RepID=E9GA62_DAPPU|nr:hypothetical protein DAPPUDRAFT_100364 [Daphnia pulex]|eukprot:EFX83685.1 hypothetical protein DAPPUDRAFT_100364 [Daphnia pulex]
MGIVFIRTWSMSLVVSFLILFSSSISQVIADEDEIISRTSNVHSVYSPMSDQHDGSLESPAAGPTPSDWAGHANPYSRNKKYEQQYYDPSAYHHHSQHSRPQKKEYGYYPAPPPSKKPGKGSKDKDHLLEFFAHFFDKKKELEDEIWDLIFHKGVGGGGGDEDYKGQYGEPPSGYHQTGVHKKPESKEKIFLKIKLLAIASTVLLIVLGGGILLAPLAIGKGRSEFLRALNPAGGGGAPTEMAHLAANVLQAIQSYQQRQTI